MQWEYMNICMTCYLKILMKMHKWMHDENTCRKCIFFIFFNECMMIWKFISLYFSFFIFWKCTNDCIKLYFRMHERMHKKTLSLFIFYFSCMNRNLCFNEWECIKLLFLFLVFFYFFIISFLYMKFWRECI